MPRRKPAARSSIPREISRELNLISAMPDYDKQHVSTLARMIRRVVAEHSKLGRAALMLVVAETIVKSKEQHHENR